jgi:hypothetical protein
LAQPFVNKLDHLARVPVIKMIRAIDEQASCAWRCGSNDFLRILVKELRLLASDKR